MTGIWQNESQKERYYSIHQNNDGGLILIDLFRLEFGGTTLSATYLGTVGDPVLKQLANFPLKEEFDFNIKVKFINANEATIEPDVVDDSVFDIFHIKIKKIIGEN